MATSNESENDSFALFPEGEEKSLVAMKLEWIRKQEELKKQLITHDDFSWHIPPCQKSTTKTETEGESSDSFQSIHSNSTQTEEFQNHLHDQGCGNLFQTHFSVNTVSFQPPESVNTTTVNPLTSPFSLDSAILATNGNPPSKNVNISDQILVENSNSDRKSKSLRSFSNTCDSRIIRTDDYSIPSNSKTEIRYIGGVDISFDPEDQEMACAAIIVLEFSSMKVVYEAYESVKMTLPYIAGFLAFRECPVLLRLLEQLSKENPELVPQVLMVDGNGLLHPRGFGLACHLGVLANIPTIGIGKNMHHFDGMTANGIRELASEFNIQSGEGISLIGSSGQTWGAALRSHKDCVKPIFVSIGHQISLVTAVTLVHRCCIFRIPEPVRQADKRSRHRLNKNM